MRSYVKDSKLRRCPPTSVLFKNKNRSGRTQHNLQQFLSTPSLRYGVRLLAHLVDLLPQPRDQ